MFVAGQRWISEMEPELGLGVVVDAAHRRVTLSFPAANCTRQYAVDSSRLYRVEYHEGDTIQTVDGESMKVTGRIEQAGVLVYQTSAGDVSELRLSPTLAFKGPMEKLLAGLIEPNRAFDLRYHALTHQHRIQKMTVQGFLGGRVDLVPHQLFIAQEVAKRPLPRVLLSDEVGLGKTIEACLILHRLLVTRRINRVLIAVPESLKHQWFVELLRKFNLLFRLLDVESMESGRSAEIEVNPFANDALCLVSHEFLVNHAEAGLKACEAGWDMVVVDEAHHLSEKSPAYQIFSRLSKVTQGLMLLTATPEQMGRKGHFSRLQLLDANRYFDYEAFQKESQTYHTAARIANFLLEGQIPDSELLTLLKTCLSDVENFDLKTDRQAIINALIDRHGPGRVIFRNRRQVMPGFPKRAAHLIALHGHAEALNRYQQEFESDQKQAAFFPDYKEDPRLVWLAEFVRSNRKVKILVICKTKEKVKAIEEALRHHIRVPVTVFHEAFSLIQRDKNAAWFARPDGAQLLISSEIGSEGRNFQFAHHLVLFDVPTDPELLEQRIGRLDRIGQKRDVQIHIPYLKGSAQEKLVRWYHEGLNAFESYVTGAYEVYQKMKPDLFQCLDGKSDLASLAARTHQFAAQVEAELKAGRDHLLEMASFRKQEAETLTEAIRKVDEDTVCERFAIRLFDHFGIRMEPVIPRTYQVKFDALTHHEFPVPVLRESGLVATFDRKQAVHLEDVEFITWDHPMLTGAIELFLGMNAGNAVLTEWKHAPEPGFLLDAVFVLECVAPPELHVGRFLPPRPVRVVVDHLENNVTDRYDVHMMRKKCRSMERSAVLEQTQIKELLARMVKTAEQIAEKQQSVLIEEAQKEMHDLLQIEIARMKSLQKVNPDVSEDEIELLAAEKETLSDLLKHARLRLDAVRVAVLTGE